MKNVNRNEERGSGRYPSLYNAFNLGDRVKRDYKEKDGKTKEYRGTVLAIDKESIEIYWDTVDGKFRPEDMGVAFTTCPVYEIFNGNENYTPIKKEH